MIFLGKCLVFEVALKNPTALKQLEDSVVSTLKYKCKKKNCQTESRNEGKAMSTIIKAMEIIF